MSEKRERRPIFMGLLFQGDPKNRSWTPVVNGQVGMSLQHIGGAWSLVAMKKEKVWELTIDAGFKHRVRDNFVQWQKKNSSGAVETFGLRVKSEAEANQMSEVLTKTLAKLEETKKETVAALPLSSMQPDDVMLKVFVPGRDLANICVPKSYTVQQILQSVCQRRDLDLANFVVTLPPNSPGGQPVVCQGHMSIGELSTNEIHLSKRRKSPRESPTHMEGGSKEQQMLLLQVELPKGEHTVVRVSPTISIPDLLHYICEKRNLSSGTHSFDLPATEESLANKTLQELKINSIRVLSKDPEVSSNQSPASSPTRSRKLKSQTRSQPSLESGHLRRRNAPPPPPPNQKRRTQPEFIKQLAAEVVDRKITRKSQDSDTTPNGSTDHLDTVGTELPAFRKEPGVQPKRRMTTGSAPRVPLKPRSAPAPPPPTTQATSPIVAKTRPPPVAEKPNRSKRQESVDEPDIGMALPEEPVFELLMQDSSEEEVVLKGQEVIGVKGRVQGQKDRPDLADSIGEALKKQTVAAERRYTGSSRKKVELSETRHMSLEKEGGPPSAKATTPTLAHPIMVPVDIPEDDDDQVYRNRGKTFCSRGLKRGPAPPPPSKNTTLGRHVHDKANGISRSQDDLETINGAEKPKTKGPRSPRKRPSRPAPVPPPVKAAIVQDIEIQEKILDFGNTPSPQESQAPQTLPLSQPSLSPQVSQESPSPQRSLRGSQTSQSPQASPPPKASPKPPTSQSPKTSPGTTQKAMAICHNTADGGKMLIVQPSPSTDRKAMAQAPLIFKLPPPPPQPSNGGNKGTKNGLAMGGKNMVRDNKEENKVRGGAKDGKDEQKVNKQKQRQEELKQLETEHPSNDTVLSNEYTNLDDSDDSEMVSMGEFTNKVNGIKTNGMEIDSNGMETDSIPSSSDEEGGYDIHVMIDDQSNSLKELVANGTHHQILNLSANFNNNNNNNNNSIDSADELGPPPPPPDDKNNLSDSADELGAPPPPPEFLDHTPSFNSSNESLAELPKLATDKQSTPSVGEGVLLLSYKPSAQTNGSPTLDEASYEKSQSSPENLESESSLGVYDVPCVEDVSGVEKEWREEPVSPDLSAQLNDLDSVVSDLRDLLNAEDCNKSVIVPETTPISTEAVPTSVSEVTPTDFAESSTTAIPVPPPPPPVMGVQSPPLTVSQESQPPPPLEEIQPSQSPAQESQLPLPVKEVEQPPLQDSQAPLPTQSPIEESQASQAPPPSPSSQLPPPIPEPLESISSDTLEMELIPPPIIESQDSHRSSPKQSHEAPSPPSTTSQAPQPIPIKVESVPQLSQSHTSTHSPTSQTKKSPTPSKPKPPPPPSKKAVKPQNLTRTTPPIVNPSPSPIITATKSGTGVAKSSNELLDKFRERQAKWKAQKMAEEPTTSTNPETITSIPTSNASIPNPTSIGGGNEAVQAQLQFLQQQVLQQQMLQLQQQFQQLQSLALQQQPGVGMGLPGMVPGHYQNPMMYPGTQTPPMLMGQGSFQMPPGHPTFMGQSGMYATRPPTGYTTPPNLTGYTTPPQPTGYATPPNIAGILPSHQPPGSQLFQASQLLQASQVPPASQPSQASPPSQLPLSAPIPIPSKPPPPLTASHLSRNSPETPPPPPPSEPPPDLPLSTSSPLILRRVSAETRTKALGAMEEKFDSLMGEVRESDSTVVLRKIPEVSNARRDSPEPSGMAAALEVALRQRRQHFSDQDTRRRSHEDSFSEWQSP